MLFLHGSGGKTNSLIVWVVTFFLKILHFVHSSTLLNIVFVLMTPGAAFSTLIQLHVEIFSFAVLVFESTYLKS